MGVEIIFHMEKIKWTMMVSSSETMKTVGGSTMRLIMLVIDFGTISLSLDGRRLVVKQKL
jgi:hypothetical protein